MSHRWSAEITNDPEQDYALVIEILHDDTPIGRIHRDESGKTWLTVYECPSKVHIDLDWLRTMLSEVDLPKR